MTPAPGWVEIDTGAVRHNLELVRARLGDGVRGASIGDEVAVYGRQGDDAITSAEIEWVTAQIAADLYTPWGRLLPRHGVSGITSPASLG